MKKPSIYIVHGILGNPFEYILMRKLLRKNGFASTIFTYKSRKTKIMDAAKQLYEKIKADGVVEVSFITHSLGGLVLRAMLLYSQNDAKFPKIRKIVMIAAPNQGAISGDFMNKYAIFKFILGVNLRDVKKDPESLAHQLPINFNADVGIIAGCRGKKSGYNPFIGEDNDGEIRPEETKLGTEKDFITIKSDHISILWNKKTHQQVLHFMEFGTFNHRI